MAAPDEMIGRLIGGRYRLVRRLGAGGMGTVYLCEHAALSRRYALKVLHADRASDPEVVERFRQEARAAAAIDQENVVDVLDYGEDPSGELFYVMEALDGRTLAQVMREDGPLAVQRALALFEQVCRALGAAHGRGVIHRDVKPDNVLVERLEDGSERAKLIDFGISHVPGNDRLTRDGEIIGTPEYMSPEQASGGEVDALTDVYAAGVLAYELLTGTLPLLGATAVATLVAHQSQIPDAPSVRRPGIPAEVDALVLRMLAKRPADRFPSMRALAAEVMRLRVTTLAPTAGRDGGWGGGWADERGGTGSGGTISLSALPPVEPAIAPVATGPSEPARPHQPLRSARPRVALAAVAVALILAAVFAATRSRMPAPAPIQAGVASAIPTPTPPPAPAEIATSTATSTATPAPTAVATPAARPTEPPPPPAAARPAPRPPPGAEPRAPAGDVKDPYATPADPLKPDPFR